MHINGFLYLALSMVQRPEKRKSVQRQPSRRCSTKLFLELCTQQPAPSIHDRLAPWTLPRFAGRASSRLQECGTLPRWTVALCASHLCRAVLKFLGSRLLRSTSPPWKYGPGLRAEKSAFLISWSVILIHSSVWGQCEQRHPIKESPLYTGLLGVSSIHSSKHGTTPSHPIPWSFSSAFPL